MACPVRTIHVIGSTRCTMRDYIKIDSAVCKCIANKHTDREAIDNRLVARIFMLFLKVIQEYLYVLYGFEQRFGACTPWTNLSTHGSA